MLQHVRFNTPKFYFFTFAFYQQPCNIDTTTFKQSWKGVCKLSLKLLYSLLAA